MLCYKITHAPLHLNAQFICYPKLHDKRVKVICTHACWNRICGNSSSIVHSAAMCPWHWYLPCWMMSLSTLLGHFEQFMVSQITFWRFAYPCTVDLMSHFQSLRACSIQKCCLTWRKHFLQYSVVHVVTNLVKIGVGKHITWNVWAAYLIPQDGTTKTWLQGCNRVCRNLHGLQ